MTTRKEIRNSVASLLPDQIKTVFKSYEPSINQVDLPAACVYFNEGDSELQTFDLTGQWTSEIQIEIYAEKGKEESIDDALDSLGDLVSKAIKSKPKLEGLVDSIIESGFAYSRDDDRPIGMLLLTYSVQWEG